MPTGQMNRVIWALMLLLLAVLAYHTRDRIELMFLGVGKLEVTEVPERDKVILHWRGQIEAPMLDRLSEAFEKHKNSARSIVVSLSSPGGALEHGARVIRLLNKIAETHSLETFVGERRVCASMCVPVYLQGAKRTAADSARFMFHEVSYREQLSDDAIDVPKSAISSATDRFFQKYFEPVGVKEGWIKRVRASITGGNEVWKSARELVDEDAGIVQELRGEKGNKESK